MSQKKILTSSLIILAIFIVMLLAAGISNLEFQPSVPEPRNRESFQLRPLKLQSVPPIIDQILLVIFSVIVPIGIVLFIKSPEFRKLALRRILMMTMLGLLLFSIINRNQEEVPVEEQLVEDVVDNAFLEAQRDALTFVDTVTQPAPELNIFLDIAILLGTALLIWYLYRRFFRADSTPTDQLKTEIEGAISEIQAGENLRNVIIRCYADMSQILNEKRGIQRDQAMTPREFEIELQDVGIPSTAVQRLTRLFEAARYGNADLGPEAEQEALLCLMSIAEAC
jgi:hypothetical protein